jgi:hypothetical protein
MHSATVLPLHGGRAPRWLFGRMVKLSERISNVIIDEFGADELLRRISDKDWFQALACAIGYDWHSSGTTTVTIGALKEALNESGEIFIAGGKGKAGTNTPNDIQEGTARLSISGSADKFTEFSRISAKIDAGMVYDNIGIYHHAFLFTKSGKWAVVQQAMQHEGNKAIRFQWFSDLINASDIANEPHSGIDSSMRQQTLDLTYRENKFARESMPAALEEYSRVVAGSYPDRHGIIPRIDISRRGIEVIKKASELEPKDYRELLLVRGFGRSSIRSLAFVASLIYDKQLAYRDPITYAYNLGGKDGIPFPVSKKTYDSVIEGMDYIIDKANIEKGDKYRILKMLNALSTKS